MGSFWVVIFTHCRSWMVAPCSPFLGHVSGQLHEGIGSPTFCLHQLPHCHGNTRTRRLQNRSEYLKAERRQNSILTVYVGQFGSLQLKTDRDNKKDIFFKQVCDERLTWTELCRKWSRIHLKRHISLLQPALRWHIHVNLDFHKYHKQLDHRAKVNSWKLTI